MPQKSFEKNIFSPFQNLITKIVEVKYKNKLIFLICLKNFQMKLSLYLFKFSYDEIGDKR